MVTISTKVGLFYFADFVQLGSGQSAVLDETLLKENQLKNLLVAIKTDRVITSEADLLKIETALSSASGGIDPTILDKKEDKLNKVNTFTSNLSITKYPTTQAVVDYITTVNSGYITGSSLTSTLAAYTTKTYVDSLSTTVSNAKVDKTQLGVASGVATLDAGGKLKAAQVPVKIDTPIPVSSVTSTPVETLPTGYVSATGGYVLATPDSWIKVGDMYVPAYKETTIGTIAIV